MSLLNQIMKPAELFIGGSFADDFKDAQSVIQNGGTITGTPSIDNGITLDGVGDYVTYVAPDILNNAQLSFTFDFIPNFEADDNLAHYFMSDTLGDYRIIKFTDNTLTFTMNTGGFTVSLANYQSYWLTGKRNFLQVVTTSGDNKVFLNGIQLTVAGSTAAWTPASQASVNIGARHTGIQLFDGKMCCVKIFKSLLTAQDAQNFYDNSTYKYMDDAVVNLSFKAAQHDPTNTRTLDISGNNNHATFGDGVTSTTFPTKTQRRGYSFDGGDYNVITNDTTLAFGTDDFTVAALVKSSIVNNATHWIIDKGFGEANNRLILGLDSTNKLKIHVGAIEAAGSVINEDSYYTVVGVRNGDNVYLYVNGIEDASNTGASAKVITSTTDLYIGARSATPASYWDGEMSVVYLLNGKGLTPLQVADLHINMLQEINHV